MLDKPGSRLAAFPPLLRLMSLFRTQSVRPSFTSEQNKHSTCRTMVVIIGRVEAAIFPLETSPAFWLTRETPTRFLQGTRTKTVRWVAAFIDPTILAPPGCASMPANIACLVCVFGLSRWTRTTRILCLSVRTQRSEEHTSELQSLTNLVCRLLLEKKKNSYTVRSYINIACCFARRKRNRLNSLFYEYRLT